MSNREQAPQETPPPPATHSDGTPIDVPVIKWEELPKVPLAGIRKGFGLGTVGGTSDDPPQRRPDPPGDGESGTR